MQTNYQMSEKVIQAYNQFDPALRLIFSELLDEGCTYQEAIELLSQSLRINVEA
jgi:hypothetical protein